MFWGKLRQTPIETRYLPLSHHCLDVAWVLRHLLDRPVVARRLAGAGADLQPAQKDRLAVLAMLHDFGKANLGFQDKPFDPHAPRAGHVREVAPLFMEHDLADALRQAIELPVLQGWFAHGLEDLQAFFFVLLSHHGTPLRADDISQTAQNYYLAKTRWWRPDGERDPFAAIADLMKMARGAFPAAFDPDVPPLPSDPELQHRLAGLLMLADWLGSDERFFPIDNGQADRLALAPSAARHALCTVGLDPTGWQQALARAWASFPDVFGFRPRPLQVTLDGLDVDTPRHRLLIAESDTGSGKTEAALIRFLRLFEAGEVDGLYFALPTRVAARELYGRVRAFVERLFPDPNDRPPVLLAVPGYASVDGERVLPDRTGRAFDEGPDRAQEEHHWAAQHPKRFLAATVAVGTVDQALLSAIQTRHAHLRSVCLDRQLLVVDEVHASDRYMSYLLAELLRHHLRHGHALLLSATLGSDARNRFLQAAGCDAERLNLEQAAALPYPALTDAEGEQLPLHEGAPPSGKSVRVECRPWLGQHAPVLAEIATALRAGTRVLVVCNTVGEALALQRAAEEHPDIPADTLFRHHGVVTPHHGRYAPADREHLDAAVSARLGKGSPPGPLLLIGTQTLEQSLDIDADLLVSDLCPMDVLLQRIGRLHRHRRERPEGYRQARCLLRVPDVADLSAWLRSDGTADGAAARLGIGSVYPDLRSLQRTWETVTSTPLIEIPRDNRRLVEAATHPQSLSHLTGPRWERHATVLEGAGIAHDVHAHQVSLPPLYDRPFGQFHFNELTEQVRTRLGLDSLRLPLPEPVTGPFGVLLREMVIPGHLCPDPGSEPAITDLRQAAGEITFTIGSHHFRYTRLGLERIHTDNPHDEDLAP